MQATSLEYDVDTGVLRLRLDDNTEYRVDHPWHARTLKDKITVGGTISSAQRAWLEHYRVIVRQTNRARLQERLAQLRREIREL